MDKFLLQLLAIGLCLPRDSRVKPQDDYAATMTLQTYSWIPWRIERAISIKKFQHMGCGLLIIPQTVNKNG